MVAHPRFVRADNPGPFTLEGTRTYLIGRRLVAVIDPGPDIPAHVEAVADEVAGADAVTVLLTHGHGDHASAAPLLAERIEARVLGPAGVPESAQPLAEGDVVQTDEGALVAMATPGHAPEQLAFHWPERRALFAGDLLLGRGDTTWVGGYPGCVRDYLDSLARVRMLELDVIYPTHGPPLVNAGEALDRFEEHRLERIRQVREALGRHPDATPDRLLELVYGSALPEAARRAALLSVEALRDHVEREGP